MTHNYENKLFGICLINYICSYSILSNSHSKEEQLRIWCSGAGHVKIKTVKKSNTWPYALDKIISNEPVIWKSLSDAMLQTWLGLRGLENTYIKKRL